MIVRYCLDRERKNQEVIPMQALNRIDKALSPQQLRVAELIAAGCSVKQVISATGYSASYISELGKLDEFKVLVAEKAGARVERAIKVQDRYDSLESGLLEGIRERAATADMSELTRALDVVSKNNPKRKGQVGAGERQGDGGSVTVTVNLPEHVLGGLDIQTNARNEVIEVGGIAMEPLTAKAISDRLSGQD